MAIEKRVISCCAVMLALPWATRAVADDAILSEDHSLRIVLTDADKRLVPDAVVGVVTADGTWDVADAQHDGTYYVTGLWTKTILDIDHPLYDGGDIALNLPPQSVSSVYIQLVDGLAARVTLRDEAEVWPNRDDAPNDFCEEAFEVGCDSATTFDNTAATTDATEPPFSCHFGGPAQGVNNMWFTFVATDTSAFLDTNSSAVSDTLLAVYDGTCGSLVEIACSEDEGVGLLSEVCVESLTIGNTYYVQVGSYSAASVGETTLNIQCPCMGANDFCEEAFEVGCDSTTTFDNTAATTDVTEPPFSCHFGGPAQGVNNMWFTFVATDTSAFLDTNSSTGANDTLLAVYDGTCGSLVEIACSEDEGVGLLSEVCVEGLTIGNTYYVQVGSYSAASVGEVTLNIECPCPNLNDFCDDAIEVGCNTATTFDNSEATTDATEPPFSCHFGGPAQGVNNMWFTFVATDTSAFLDTNSSAVSDTLLAVYDGTCGSLVEIACSEDEGEGLLSEVCAEGLTIGNTYYVQVGSFSAASVGSITLNIECPCAIAASMDIKPGSCPNSYNRSSHGVLPVGLLGTDDFDVTQVDLSSLLLFRADGVGGAVAPHEGPPGPHTVVADVGTPFEGELCGCHELEGDDLLDLSMKFKSDEVVASLELSDLSPGALVELMLMGELLDGTVFFASDCVRLVPPGTPPGEMVVTSSIPGVWIDSSPVDLQLDGGGFTDFQRTYPAGTVVALTAPDLVNGRPFKRWVVDGELQPAGVRTIEVTIDEGLMSVDLELRWSPPNIPPRDKLAPDRLLGP